MNIPFKPEWTETLEDRWNTLCFDDLSKLQDILDKTPGRYMKGLYGTGDASARISKEIESCLTQQST